VKGSFKFYNTPRGFGFIRGSDGREYFAHATALAAGLQPHDGMQVEFIPGESERGPLATLIRESSVDNKEREVELAWLQRDAERTA
jgi:CspA family cold shock protein